MEAPLERLTLAAAATEQGGALGGAAAEEEVLRALAELKAVQERLRELA